MKNILIIVVGALFALTATTASAQLRLDPVNHSGKGVTATIQNGKLVVSGTRPVNGDNCERAPATWAFELPQPPKDTTPQQPTTITIDNSINVNGNRNVTGNFIYNTGIIMTGDVVVNACCPEPAPAVAPIVAPKKEWSANILAGPFMEVLGNKGPLPTGGRVGLFIEVVAGKKEQPGLRFDFLTGAEVYLGPGKRTLEPEGVSHCDTCGVATEFDPDDKGNGLEPNSTFFVGTRISKKAGRFTFSVDVTAKYDSGSEHSEDGISAGLSAQAEYELGQDTSVFVNVSQRANPWASNREYTQGSISFGGVYRF